MTEKIGVLLVGIIVLSIAITWTYSIFTSDMPWRYSEMHDEFKGPNTILYIGVLMAWIAGTAIIYSSIKSW